MENVKLEIELKVLSYEFSFMRTHIMEIRAKHANHVQGTILRDVWSKLIDVEHLLEEITR